MAEENPEMKIKAFQVVQIYLDDMGFSLNQQQNNRWRFSYGQMKFIFVLSINIVLLVMCMIYDARTVEAYMDSIISASMAFTIFMCYISIIFKTDQLFEIIDGCERLINEGKYRI